MQETLGALTTLVAAHGVYALSVIFIFYQQRCAFQNLRDVSEGPDKRYFRRVHGSVVVATYVLVLVSTVVWIYATFVYEPVKPIKGEVTGLHEPLGWADGEPVRTHHQISPDRAGDLDFYSVNASSGGEYRFRWMLLARENLRQIAFRFVQTSEVPTNASRFNLDAPPGVNPSASDRKVIKLEKRFILNLGALHYSPTQAIHLAYRPDEADSTKLGTLWLSKADGNRAQIQWDGDAGLAEVRAAKPISERLRGALSFSVLAAAIGASPMFNADGSYDPESARALQLQLGSSDLRTRLFARQMLVENGSRAFRFVLDTLDKKGAAQSSDRTLLIDSLAKAIDEIELRGAPFPPQGHLKLAVALYEAKNYKSAGYHFDQASAAVPSGDAQHLSMRAHAYLESERYAEAIPSFNEYIAANISPQDRAWARNALGFIYYKLGRLDDSIRERREVLRLAPNYASALNNQAYVLAKKGESLAEALTLVDRALKQEPDEPNYVETRGYVLYRLGRLSEAVELIRRAAAKMPNDPDTQKDLKEVEDAIRSERRTAAPPRGVASK